MPYSNIKELPSGVKDNLPSHGATIYLNAFNSAKKSGKDDESAAKIAWSAVHSRYRKDKDGKWVSNSLIDFIEKSYMDVIHIAENERNPQPKKNLVEFSMFINKANLDQQTGKMVWAATGSDTMKDSFNEDMSVELFKSFLDYIDHGVNLPIYLSLAHYPRLEGKGEGGVATDIFIDGNTLKAKGYFSDNPLGVKIYNAIRKDRRDNTPQDKRVRISIGFYDQMHKHSNGTIWQYKSGISCAECEKNPKGGKTYLSGILEHFAVTRVPVNKRTAIVAKSEGDMTTRYEDAMSIVEDSSVVDPIEKALQEERKDRSETNLIVKSNPNPVGNAADIVVPDMAAVSPNNPTLSSYQILAGLPKEKLLDLFSKMEMDGTLTKDGVSELVNYIMNDLTDRSNTVNGGPVSAEKPEKKKKDIVAGENPETEILNDIAGHFEMSDITDKTEARKDVTPADKKHAEKEYGNVNFADEENKKYPIDTAEHIRAAWNYINKEANAAKYGGKVGGIKAKIVSAWKEKISKDGPPSAQKSDVDESNTEETTNMSKSKDSADKDKDPEDEKEGPETKPENDAEDKKEKLKKKSEPDADGGKSTADTQPESVKLIGAMEQLMSLMRQLLERPASVATIGTPVTAAQEPSGEFNQPLANGTPDLTTANNQKGPGNPTGQGPAGTWDENSPIKGVVSDFSESMKNAIQKSGSERMMAFQEIINNTANQMKDLHQTLENTENPTNKSETQSSTANVEEVVNRIIDEKLVPVQAGMAEIKSLIQGLSVGKANTRKETKELETPKMKSIVSFNSIPQVQKSQLKSIAQIANETTFGALGK